MHSFQKTGGSHRQAKTCTSASPAVSGYRSGYRSVLVAAAVCLIVALSTSAPLEAEVPSFTVGWSAYAGWNPYFYMQKSGILKKWADKYGIAIKVQRFDYAASLDSFVAKNIDACTMTNMEALDMPAASGVDTTAILMGDYSNGNDAVLTRNGIGFDKIGGKKVMLVQKTVSEYLLERAMVLNGQQSKLSSLRLINTSDSDIAPAFMNNAANEVVVTWKPLVSQILGDQGVHSIFDSSKIPGEILDLLVVQTSVLNRPDGSGEKFAKAMAGAWYETMQRLTSGGPQQAEALKISAGASGDTVDSYREQLKTTALFSTPQAAVEFTTSPTLKQKMELVRQFCFTHGLLGKGIKSVDDVAITYPDSSVQGRKDRVRLRFDVKYMQAAMQGKL
ncbi:NitT/TauT family transport system substrate-binding protein [Granulicella pectinivorans]|uniref:NitT/TauT family transport system substrate-binding protein n=1 Tax=Granulicella pectinivorans TaxID=474950 RepID=A0A1I6M5Y1_9BACT|nr:NitT/TauT family transport system substrate-binding protein [Granulicella pectinivorans]